MEKCLRKAGLLIYGALLLASNVKSQSPQLEITYTGEPEYPGNKDSVLTCTFQHTIANDSSDLAVFWSRQNPVTENFQKIAVSKPVQENCYVYESAPAFIKDRFKVSSVKLRDGTAEATIYNTTLEDSGTYRCEIEYVKLRLAKGTSFDIRVYYLPTTYVEDKMINLDIRPVEASEEPEPEKPAATEPTPSIQSNGTTAYNETEEAIPEPEPEPTTEPEVEKVIITCHAQGAFPKPSKFEFTAENSALVWIVDATKFSEPTQNDDETFDASADLKIEPTSDLDGEIIKCRVFLTENLRKDALNTSAVISVQYLPTKVSISMSEDAVKAGSQVSIKCTADGNPTPEITLFRKTSDGTQTMNQVSKFTANKLSAGMYICQVQNGDVTLKDEKELIVKYIDQPTLSTNGKEIMNGKMELTEGTNVEVECFAEAKPGYASYKWKQPDGSEVTGKRLTLQSVEYTHSGSYECTATGVEKKSTSFKLEVNGKCTITSFTKHVSSSKLTPAGDAHISLTCEATGNPGCTMNIVPQMDGKYTTETNHIVLQIPAYKKTSVAPVFNCTATNSFGSIRRSLTVNDDWACCTSSKQKDAGVSTGIIILIIILAALVIVGIPIGWYYCKRTSTPPTSKNGKALEAGEDQRLAGAEQNQA